MEKAPSKGFKKKNFKDLDTRRRAGLLVVAVIILVLVVGWLVGWWFVADETYQAVFLTNDQVYFGKLSNQTSQYAVLTDIYYLRVTEALQPSQPRPNINLVKLGDELHGPLDRMEINRDHILFIEDLNPDSAVVTAIKNFKAAQ